VIGGDQAKIMRWYDNESGCSSQSVRDAARIAATIEGR
jgi:glyceraldehyde-3-phosphate dehydrogenase/erythrose-4-phosphate dehydrogenase